MKLGLRRPGAARKAGEVIQKKLIGGVILVQIPFLDSFAEVTVFLLLGGFFGPVCDVRRVRWTGGDEFLTELTGHAKIRFRGDFGEVEQEQAGAGDVIMGLVREPSYFRGFPQALSRVHVHVFAEW
jgi:hypothetical protein